MTTARHHLDNAIELAPAFGATVVLMHAYGVPSYNHPEEQGHATADYLHARTRCARRAEERVIARKDVNIPIATAL